MVLDFLSRRKSVNPKSEKEPVKETTAQPTVEEKQKPILTDEEEAFLERIAAEGTPPQLPARPSSTQEVPTSGKNAQEALMDGADQIALPKSPETEPQTTATKDLNEALRSPTTEEKKKKKNYWAYVPDAIARRNSKLEAKKAGNAEDSTSEAVLEKEEKREEDDLTSVLDQLNLSAVNNRAFSFSKESSELLDKFKLVLKDVVNGVPTAYDDLEKLFTNSEDQLQKLFNGLPPFLQNLVKTLPSKLTAGLGPEVLAVAAEKPTMNSKLSALGKEGLKASKRIPSLKKLVTSQGAIAGILRSILQFLKLRFPAVLTGTNVIMSVAVFLLMFVLWYCHKRGREVRLAKEAAGAEDLSASEIEDSTADIGVPPGAIGDASTSTRAQAANAPTSPPALSHRDLPTVLNLPEPATSTMARPRTPEIREPEKQ